MNTLTLYSAACVIFISIILFKVHGLRGSFELHHRDGPAGRLVTQKAERTQEEIITLDEYRVKWINALTNFNTTIDVNTGISLSTGGFIAMINIGEQMKPFPFIIDTGSTLTWMQCKPCEKCYVQHEDLFDPTSSNSFSKLSCGSSACQILNKPSRCAKEDSLCQYKTKYADGSFTAGYLAKETFWLALSNSSEYDGIHNLVFGCSQEYGGTSFGEAAGILGLGPQPLSFVSQTVKVYGDVFSYCLPTIDGSNGHLTFGKSDGLDNLRYTPLNIHTNGYFYINHIQDIIVGEKRLKIDEKLWDEGILIDSGTRITRLPRPIYTLFRDIFRSTMEDFRMTEPTNLFDTCYDLIFAPYNPNPTISIIFKNNVEVLYDSTKILYEVEGLSKMCLAFAPTDGIAILGSLHQETLDIVFDIAQQRLYIKYLGCN